MRPPSPAPPLQPLTCTPASPQPPWNVTVYTSMEALGYLTASPYVLAQPQVRIPVLVCCCWKMLYSIFLAYYMLMQPCLDAGA